MENCLFCKIIKGEIQSNIVFEDEFTFAFRDINPAAPTHILVIPKTHISGLNDLNNVNINIMTKLTSTAREICNTEKIESEGYRWVINSGEYGGQTVFHLHLHVLSGRNLKWPPG